MNESALARAAAGELPDWAQVTAGRRAHIERVAELMTAWARELVPDSIDLWRAAAWLHDALRDADPRDLRNQLDPEFCAWPDALLHGPAAAFRLRREHPAVPGNLLDAISYHTVGHARLDSLGRALYLADFLEPGRTISPVWRATLRVQMPAGLQLVLRQVAASRIAHLLRNESALRPETVGFWNAIVSG